jgi:predicted ATPase
MLTRIYVDNYKSLVNFELKVQPINLLLGPNGAGKSSVFDVLRKLRDFITGEKKIPELFEPESMTRWQTLRVQTFELEIQIEPGLYKYELAVEHDESGQKSRVKNERLSMDGRPLLRFEQGTMHLYRDDFSPGPEYPFDWTLSAVASIFARHDNKKLTGFKEQIQKFIIVQGVPVLMSSESNQEETTPGLHLEKFVSWYRYLSQDQGLALDVTDSLRKILTGFDYFGFETFGDKNRRLQVYFSYPGPKKRISYKLDELSDGQKILIALYTLLIAAQKYGYILFLDEPDYYLALPEIRPWLVELYERCAENKIQALLISHHPEMIDYLLASPTGYWLERQDNLATRVKLIQAENDGGLTISELFARGWLHE